MKTQFRLTIGLLIIIILASAGTYLRIWDINFLIGPFYLHHWVGIIGGTYLLISAAIYAYIKRNLKVKKGTILQVHIAGNLLAVLLISIHFAQHMGRPPEFAPDYGTGLASFLLLLFILIAGIFMRFGIPPRKHESWHLIHVGFALSLFIVFIVHALKNFGIL
ncbi:MAG: hypothetical protein R6U08_08215 [Bacillota bacterium]